MEALSTIASVIGLPATIALAWMAFVVYDHHRRIRKLEEDLQKAGEEFDKDLTKVQDQLSQAIQDLAEKFENKINELSKDQRGEIALLSKSMSTMAQDVAWIKSLMMQQYGIHPPKQIQLEG